MQALAELLDPWIEKLRTGRDPYSYAELLRETVRNPMVTARGNLDRLTGREEAEVLVGALEDAFERYSHARGCVTTYIEQAGPVVRRLPEYERWYGADQEALRERQRVNVMSSLAVQGVRLAGDGLGAAPVPIRESMGEDGPSSFSNAVAVPRNVSRATVQELLGFGAFSSVHLVTNQIPRPNQLPARRCRRPSLGSRHAQPTRRKPAPTSRRA
jgi:hypothetical protein